MKKILCLAISSLIIWQSCSQPKRDYRSMDYLPELEDVYKVISKADNMRSFLVSKDDQLIAEEYFERYPSDSLDHVRSVTKSVMSILIGIAIDQDIIPSVDESIHSYLGEAVPGEEIISIKHLLTMTSGISWDEGTNASGYGAWASSPNELQYVLDKSMAATPGTIWNYNSGAIHILSAILTKASGMSTLAFANKFLFEPMGIDHVKWERQSDGYYNGAAGLELIPRDMIRLGQLIANGGTNNGKRILSERFITEATTQHQPKGMKVGAYGYCWWLDGGDGIQLFAALGYAGQTIAISPQLNLVISMTYNWRGLSASQVAKQQEESTNTIVPLVLKAFLEQ